MEAAAVDYLGVVISSTGAILKCKSENIVISE